MRWKRNSVLMAVIGLIALLAGCGKIVDEASDALQQTASRITSTVQTQNLNPFASYTSANLSALVPSSVRVSSSLGASATSNAAYLDLYNQLVHGLKNNFSFTIVRTYKVTYSIPGYSQPLTALVAVPMDLNPLNRLSLPMISLQHPTQVLRSQSPSKVSVFEDEELTVPYGTMLAAMGYIVVMADYPGMGTTTISIPTAWPPWPNRSPA